MNQKMLNIQTKRLMKSYTDIGDAVISFSLQLFRVYSDKYYTDSNNKQQIKNDWKNYIKNNFPKLGVKKSLEYLKIGETIYKYEKALNIKKLASIRETTWIEIINLIKNYEDEMIKEILIDFQNKIDPAYALKLFKKILENKKNEK